MRCDAHNWMQGWIVVKDNPYYTLTDEQREMFVSSLTAAGLPS